jgi:hypothetical protein
MTGCLCLGTLLPDVDKDWFPSHQSTSNSLGALPGNSLLLLRGVCRDTGGRQMCSVICAARHDTLACAVICAVPC